MTSFRAYEHRIPGRAILFHIFILCKEGLRIRAISAFARCLGPLRLRFGFYVVKGRIALFQSNVGLCC